MKKLTKNILNATAFGVVSVASFGSLALTLVSCKSNDDGNHDLPPAPPMPPENKLSKLLFDKKNNQINLINPYNVPEKTFINTPDVDKNGNPIIVTRDYIKSLGEYKKKIDTIKEDKYIFRNYLLGLTNDYINKTIDQFRIPKSFVVANVKSDFNKKTCDIVVQFTNQTSHIIKNSEVALNPGEYIAKSINLDFSNIQFSFDNLNKLVINGANITGKTDINGNVSSWDKISESYQINGKSNLFNTTATNSTTRSSNNQEIEQWKNKYFNDQSSTQEILTHINKSIVDKVALAQAIADNVQPIGDMIANNTNIQTFLNSIGTNVANILNLFDSTKDFSTLVGHILSVNGNAENIVNDINDLVAIHKLPEQIASFITGFIQNQLKGKTFVEWLMTLNYSNIHDLIILISSSLPPQVKNIVDILDTYFNLVSQLSKGGTLANVGILETLANPIIVEQVPNLLQKIKIIVPSSQQKIIDIIIGLWNEIKPNWTVENIKTLFSNIFNPYIGIDNLTQPTKLNEALKTTMSITTPPGTISLNPDSKSYNIDQNIKIVFTNELRFKLDGLKALLKNVKISTIINVIGAQVPSAINPIIDKLGTLGQLLPATFDIKSNEGVDIKIKDQNAILQPNKFGYQIIANKYVNINLSNTFQNFVDKTLANLNGFISAIIKPIIKPYIEVIKNYYFGFDFAINSPFQIEDNNLKLEAQNVYDGTNEFCIADETLNELKNTILPNYIKQKIDSIVDKKQLIVDVDQNLKQKILTDLKINSIYQNDIHIQICIQPSFDVNASSTKAPTLANAWVLIQFNQPFLNKSSKSNWYWTQNFVIDNLNLSIINTPSA